MAQAYDVRASIKVCMFDQYGTVVDMQTLMEALTSYACAIAVPRKPFGESSADHETLHAGGSVIAVPR